jgi:hypothetical protein
MSWVLLQYERAFDDVWSTLTEAERDSIRPRLAQVWTRGNQATFPITESFGDGLFEVRGRAKKVRVRFLFGFLPGRRIVIVWGGKKDQRKLPAAVIKHARRQLELAKASLEVLHGVNIH